MDEILSGLQAVQKQIEKNIESLEAILKKGGRV
jgi:hypothetical protein